MPKKSGHKKWSAWGKVKGSKSHSGKPVYARHQKYWDRDGKPHFRTQTKYGKTGKIQTS